MSTSFYRGEMPLKADKLNLAFSERVSRDGDTMTGLLTLAVNPVSAFDAATKQYVDTVASTPGPPGPPGSILDFASPPPMGSTTPNTGAFTTLKVGGLGPITGFGSSIGHALGPLINYQGSGLPGLHLGQRLVLDTIPTTATDFATLQINRTTTFTAAASSNLNSAIRLSGNIGANDGTKNWLFASTQSSIGNNGGQNVGAFIQATRAPGGTDFVIATISDARDTTGGASSTSKQLVALELDIEANRADDGVNGGAFGGIGIRKGINIVGMRYDAADMVQTEISNGIWFSTATPTNLTTTDALTNFQSIVGFATNTQIRAALDTRGAITPTGSANPVSAVTMTLGHIIDFNGGATLSSAPGNYLQYTATGTARLRYVAGATEAFSVSNAGAITSIGAFDTTSTVRGQAGLLAGTNSVAGTINVNGAAGQTRYIQFNTAGVQRMRFGIDNTAEGGGNAGSVPFINVATDAGVASQAWSVNRNTLQSSIPRLRLGQAIAYTGGAANNDTAALNISASYSGTTNGAGWVNLNGLSINSDTLDPGTNQQAIGFNIAHNIGGTGAGGNRTALRVQITSTGAFPSNSNFQGVLSAVTMQHSSGGSDVWENAAGVVFGGATYGTLFPGATNYRGVVGHEIDYGIYAGATAAGVTGLQIVRWVTHAYSPPNFDNDNVLKLVSGGSTNQAKIGIQFGDINGFPPIDPLGKMMDVVISASGDHTTPMGYGLDLKMPTFAGSAFRSNGFSVRGDGSVQVGTVYLSSSAAGSSLDAKGSYVSAVAVVSGGANLHTFEMLIDDATGTVLSITSVDGSGAITGLSIYRVGYSLSPPANPVPFRVVGYSPANAFGQPSAPTINLTWTAQNALSIQPTASGKLGFNGATPIVKPTGVAVTAAGIHAALTSLGLIAP